MRKVIHPAGIVLPLSIHRREKNEKINGAINFGSYAIVMPARSLRVYCGRSITEREKSHKTFSSFFSLFEGFFDEQRERERGRERELCVPPPLSLAFSSHF